MYLAKRGATYYFRRPVPDELQPFLRTATGKPRTEFMQSLGTKELAAAKRLLGPAITASQHALDAAEALLVASHTPGVAATPRTPQEEYEEWARDAAWQDTLEEDCRIEAREAARDKLREFFRRPDGELTEAQLALRDMFAEGELDAPSVRGQRQKQREIDYEKAAEDFVKEWTATQDGSSQDPALRQTTAYRKIMDAFDGYVSERQPAAATVKRWRPIIAHLVAFLGHDDVGKVTDEDMVAWKDALKTEVIDDGSRRSARTISEAYLPAARVTFAYAKDSRWIKTNPVDDVSIRVPAKILTRDDLGFTDHEAAIILRASLAQDPSSETLSTRARRWLPWLCAYTGARVNELTPLLAEEVTMVDGVWTIRIKPGSSNEGDTSDVVASQRTVKTRTARSVPLHPHLIEQGFVKLVQAVGTGPLFYDPSKSKSPNPANPQHKKVAERLAAWVRELGVTDPQIKPNHAWRHLFTTIAREAGMESTALYAITGHAQKTEGGRYGRYKPKVFLHELRKFPRFNI